MMEKVPVNEEFKSEYALIYSDIKMEQPFPNVVKAFQARLDL